MQWTEFLSQVVLFHRLSDEIRAQISAELVERSLASGEILFAMGDVGDQLFIVRAGSLAVFAPDANAPGTEKPIRIICAGEVLGEMAPIDRQPRSLSARAQEPAIVLALEGSDYRRLMAEYPELALGVMQDLNDRIRYTTKFLTEVQSWVKQISSGHDTAHFLSQMQTWVNSLAEGRYEEVAQARVVYRDQVITSLAADFAQMALQVKKREEELRQQIAQLRIEIDETRKETQVAEITDTDYFRGLKAQADELRRKRMAK
jgi:CRP-like cAMP-binding protein